MNTLAAIDTFIFGPTVRYAMSVRYTVDDAVELLRAVTMPRYMWWPRFQFGLYGNVDPNRVAVGWHNPWIRDGFQPWFAGGFVQDARGLRLEGSVGFPVWQKVASYLLLPLACVRAYLEKYGLGSLPSAPPWVDIFIFTFAFGLILIVGLPRRGDAQKIADSLDAALS
jgi:hypothetical protein